jgi:hypothetical protein
MRRRPARARGRRKGREGVEADRWVPPVGAAEKRKREGGAVGRRGIGLGRLGQKGKGAGSFVFFSFLFQTSFSNQIQFKTFSNFSKLFSNIL